jgi:hypothetical protein
MLKAALVTAIATGAFAVGVIQSTATLDGRSDPCEAVPEACAEPTEPATTTTTTTTVPATTTVAPGTPTTLPPTTATP